MKVGIGYDIHAFDEGRKLVLGGVEIENSSGLGGHSDADVLVHAIMDSLLGAAGLEDIGVQFPNTDNKYKDIASLLLLEIVGDMVKKAGYLIVNIDSVVILEYPRISPYIGQMRTKISDSLKVDHGRINIKATTSEGLGFCGRKEGAAAQSVALLDEIDLL